MKYLKSWMLRIACSHCDGICLVHSFFEMSEADRNFPLHGLVQIFALFLRPKKEHKFRFYWNIYHHGVGYAILILGILNVFKGLDILDPAKKWKSAYIIVIAILGGIALFLELITWAVVLKRKSRKSTMPYNGQQTTWSSIRFLLVSHKAHSANSSSNMFRLFSFIYFLKLLFDLFPV